MSVEIGQLVYGIELNNYDACSPGGDTVTVFEVHCGKVERIPLDGSKVKLNDGSVHLMCDVCESEQQFRDWLSENVGDCSDVWYTRPLWVGTAMRVVASTEFFIAADEWGDRFVEYGDNTGNKLTVFFQDEVIRKLNINQCINYIYSEWRKFYKDDNDIRFDFPHAYRMNYEPQDDRAYACPNCGEQHNDWNDSEYIPDGSSWENIECRACGCNRTIEWNPSTIRKVEINGNDQFKLEQPEDSEDNQ